MIYLRHHLEHAGLDGVRRVAVVPLVNGWLRRELCAELRAALPGAEVEVVEHASRAPCDLVVLPLTRALHRNFLGEKTPLLVRAFRHHAPAVMLYDVVRRRADLVRRNAFAGWYARRLGEYAILRFGRMLGWRRS